MPTPQPTIQKLEAAKFPLWGSRLIEASAGTGKTWTIAALYVRLVLGHGGAGQAFARPLMPADILVMTFTRAATRELSERIRSRLLHAAQCFRGDAAVPAGDLFLQQVLADYPAGPERAQAAWRLAAAAEGMDEASVHTIDAWCQRMLREHAFDSGNLFDEELVADEQTLLTQATQDYWRQACYPLGAATLGAVLAVCKDIPTLAQDVRQLLQLGMAAADDDQPLSAVLADWAAGLAPLVADRVRQVADMRQWLLAQLADHRSHWHGSKLKAETVVQWLDSLADWAAQPQVFDLPEPDKLAKLTATNLAGAKTAKAPADLVIPPAFSWFEAVVDWLSTHPLEPLIRAHAAGQVARRMALLKRQSARFGFADMLHRLNVALQGPQGGSLRQRIVAQYPVALIDEFQDTSPLQYSLFDQVYRTQANDPASALLLIGDPKQSIYGFRGADIYSYLQARRATEGRHYVLMVNHRSTHALVQAVNHCFQQAEDGQAQAAFMFKNESDNPLPFVRVEAKGREESLLDADAVLPALTLVHDLELQNGNTLRQRFAQRCAEQIVTWLNDPSLGFAQPGEESTAKRLRPRDVAVLVRTGKEAAAVRRALQRRGVASVYLSDQESVFESAEAADLVHWLRGVASPQDAGLVRAALGVRTLGLSLDELGWLATDDEAFDERSQRLRELQQVWQTQGVLAMLRQTLHRFDLAARWLQQGDGERRLTNVLHLAELLQHASSELEGDQALIRWLVRQIDEHAAHNDEQVVRLESDADLVQVITVHKSKGLEYPVVCLPFATSYREVSSRYLKSASLPNAQGERELLLTLTKDDLDRADTERLREDLRLLYVALTRARHALWLGFAALKVGNGKDCKTHQSALGHLLGGGQALTPEGWLPVLEALAQGCPGIELQTAAPMPLPLTALSRSTAATPLQPPATYRASFDRDWGIASYSRLTRDLKAVTSGGATPGAVVAAEVSGMNGFEVAATPDAPLAVPAAAPVEPGNPLSPLHAHRPADDEGTPRWDGRPAAPAPATVADIWHRFQRGPVTGNFLHDQLEWMATEGFAHAATPERATRLHQRCERAGHGAQADELVAWLQTLAHTRLPLPDAVADGSLPQSAAGGQGGGVSLAELTQLQPEMEFWLPTQRLSTREVDQLCHAHILPGMARPGLQTSVLHGMLMGFADLVFEHQGRYWVLDYKSNHLGADDAAYHPAALRAAMVQHRYDVQAVVYLLALHRLLASRLGAAYDPAQHLGGAVYWFVRGFRGHTQGVCVITPSPEWLDPLDAMLARAGGETSSASEGAPA